MIIEDEPLIALLIEEYLQLCGFTSFDFAGSSDAAVQAAQGRCPDLITADVELSPGSGIDAVQTICSSAPIPVIFVTGVPEHVSERMPEHLLLLKPFDAEDMIEIVGVALGRSQRSGQI